MTMLVTGGAGFVGTNLCRKLLEKNHQVIAVDNFITSSPENIKDLLNNPDFLFYEQDITQPELTKILADKKIDQIYHLACPTGVPNCVRLAEEMIDACSLGTKQVLILAGKHNAPVVVTSTAEVYGDPEIFPQTEDYNGNVSTVGERSAYEEGKRFTEALVAMFVRKYKLTAKIARLFNTYGPFMSLDDPRVHPRLIQQALKNQALTVYGDGTQTRTFCYVDDTINGLELIMEKGKIGEIYNVGSDQQTQIKLLAQKIIQLTHSDSQIEFKKHFIYDHYGRLPSVEKLKNLGWQRRIELDEGLSKMVGYVKKIRNRN